ncbi:MAG TPA: hypothetical protein VJX67_08585 [Blastocatellia bacterium]|nr:hypothetical protein [Blastocatellia bacterium]
MNEATGIFGGAFVTVLKGLVSMHHTLYPSIPPQGIYFESLVEGAFDKVQKPWAVIKGSNRDLAGHDLLVDDKKLSIKTETGAGTDDALIAITKLCTTEREPWAAETLVGRVLEHLARYDVILMLRAIWKERFIHYQLVEIPVDDLRLLETGEFKPVGRRKGRQSLGADILLDGQVIFHIHFDGSDGKCQVRKLRLSNCTLLDEWDQRLPA